MILERCFSSDVYFTGNKSKKYGLTPKIDDMNQGKNQLILHCKGITSRRVCLPTEKSQKIYIKKKKFKLLAPSFPACSHG